METELWTLTDGWQAPALTGEGGNCNAEWRDQAERHLPRNEGDHSEIHLSVIIPAYNEQRRLPATLAGVLDYLALQPWRAEIIVVDDGSTDRTGDLAGELGRCALPVRVLRHPDGLNHGKGAAVRLGMLAAQGRFRLFMDADNSTSIEHVAQCWRWLDEGCEVVIASRSLPDSVLPVEQPWYRRIAGRLGNLLIRTLAVPGIADTQAGFKIFTARSAQQVFPRLTLTRWGFDIEALAIARRRGFQIREVPVTWLNAPGSKVTWRAYVDVFSEVLRVRHNLRAGLYD